MIYSNYANKILNILTARVAIPEKLDELEKEDLIAIINGVGFNRFCYLGFSSTTPNVDGTNFSEPDPTAYPSYSRIQLNVTSAMPYADIWGNPKDGEIENAKEFTSPECKEADGWPEFTHFGIFSQANGGTPIMGDYLTDPDGTPDKNGKLPYKSLKVNYEHVAVFRIGALKLKLTSVPYDDSAVAEEPEE